MQRIPLTQGQFALVDDDDFEELSQFKWHAQWARDTGSYYAVRRIRLPSGTWTKEQMHRRLLGLEYGDRRQVDHTDHQTLDNRRANIRIVTPSENQHNNRGKGYSLHTPTHKYRARITVNATVKHIGYFDTPSEARAAYLAAKRTYHPTAILDRRE